MTTAQRRIQRQRSVDAGLKATDHGDYYAFARRLARAFGRRVADSDPADLALLLALRDEVDDAIADAVRSQREAGFSWAEIAAPLAMTKQAAFKRWGQVAS
jgi:hypothetical protein